MITDIEVGLAKGFRRDVAAVARTYQSAIDEVATERNTAQREVRRLTRELRLQRAETRIERMMRTRAQLAGRA